MWVPFNVHNSRVPCCSMRAPRKTCFVSATWKRFLIIKLLLLTCMYPLFVGTFFGLLIIGQSKHYYMVNLRKVLERLAALFFDIKVLSRTFPDVGGQIQCKQRRAL